MRILHVIHSVNPRGGGPIEGIRQLAPALASLDIEMDVMSLDAPDAPWIADFPIRLFTVGPSYFGYGYTPRALTWLTQNHHRYDAVIANGIWQYASFAVWRALRKTSTPYYVYPHGMLDPWFKRRYPLKHLKKCLYWPWAEYRVLRDAKAVLFTSEEERIEARKSFRLYRCREIVTGYGIAAPSEDAPRQRALFLEHHPDLKAKRLILFLGRIHEKKGCDLLLRAWREVLQSARTGNISRMHLVMAGPVDHAYGAEIKRLAWRLGIEQRVSWPGMITGDLKWGCLRTAEVFVLSSHQENFGVSVVEALACGTPALISNKVNIWREIVEDHAGLVENDDLAGTTRLLERWIGLEPAQKEEMRNNARNCFMNRFDIIKAAKAIAVLLKSGAGPKSSPEL